MCELYKLRADPHELTNLAHDPTYAALLPEMRAAVHEHRVVGGLQARELPGS